MSKTNIITKKTQLPTAIGDVIEPGTYFTHNRLALRSSTWLIQIRKCPYCKKQHLHSFAPGQPREVKTRKSHCMGRRIGRKWPPRYTGGGEYILEPIWPVGGEK